MSGVTPRVTVLLPTTGEKGKVIEHAMRCALDQTIRDIELLVIGDGMGVSTRQVVDRFVRDDDRVRSFEFPKQDCRGTPNRHIVLTTEARGEIVCYLCDRDLWSPDHLELISDVLRERDFAYTQSLMILPDAVKPGPPLLDLARGGHRQFFLSCIRHTHEFLPLSGVGHTMDMYKRLPHGWRAGPDMPTDYYMWLQFLEMPECRVGTTIAPTLLWFPTHGWGAEASDTKAGALADWYRRTREESWLDERWRIAFQQLYIRGSVFRVRAALAEHELGWPEQ